MKKFIINPKSFTIKLAEKISALMTEDYLKEWAKRGSREKFEAALAQVADIDPVEGDEL